jgi:hypothetical protein
VITIVGIGDHDPGPGDHDQRNTHEAIDVFREAPFGDLAGQLLEGGSVVAYSGAS